MPASVHLLLVDPQNDFCDLPADWHGRDPATGARLAPALPVPGAHADMQRLAAFLRTHGERIDQLTLTLDSHHQLDVAHPAYWEQGDGSAVPPFTPIRAAQVRAGAFRPREPSVAERTLRYLDALEAQGRYTLMVWPVHCEIGSWGHGVHADVLAACRQWQVRRQRAARTVFKGANPWTEHYSAIQAEVPDPADPTTAPDTRLLGELGRAARLLIAGEASSHCVRATTEHLLDYLPRLVPGWEASRMVLLTDCMSPVTGFEAQHADFLAGAAARGVQLATTDQLQP
ncbi:hypothetical protein DFR36_10118 [Melaminivora alkalimesophila]|uniref:Nicotinamidase-related amidase n=1 Tax=Melaminivora alkalimesophila TaxID=1165852 RepID=A0A317RHF2_9BURK|nr:cysteine hydrolase [Melaminivora alkalimesophila]PWW48516.1 hypothetical protein DFR36_10118 [Melaminivora alkalimesophila]